MRLISSKRTKRRIALMFVFAFMLSNLLSLFGPSAKAAVTISAPSAGTCFQHSGTVATGGLVTVYSIGTIQITLLNTDIVPGQDATAVGTAQGAVAQATATTGAVTAANSIIGNIVSIVPPTGTNFVIVPGFADTGANLSNLILPGNATISGAQSQDATGGANTSDLAIQVGVVTTGTSGVGRAIVAIARDADTTGVATIGAETYPKSGTSGQTATISITGLGVAIPPSGEVALSGTLQATFDSTPGNLGTLGTYTTGNNTTATVASSIPSVSGSINLCTLTSPAGQLETLLDPDDTTDLYDRGPASANLLALSQIGTSTTVYAFDTATTTTAIAPIAGFTAGAQVDLEPIIIRGKAGTGNNTRDQVFAVGGLSSDISTAAQAPSGSSLDITTAFTNSVIAPITIAFTKDNAAATVTLGAVDIILEHSTAGAVPATKGLSATQTSREGYLGALRAAVLDTGNLATNASFINVTGNNWGVASIAGGPGTVTLQEAVPAVAAASFGAGFPTIASNTTDPFNNTFVDLRLQCGSATNPVAGWFAIINSNGGLGFGTTVATTAGIRNSLSGGKILTNSQTNFFRQTLTNIAGTNPAQSFMLGGISAAGGAASTSQNDDNAILYASCTNNTLTLLPVQNGFDAARDILAVTPFFTVTNISNTFTSDVNLIAQVSGNNLSGTTTLNLSKLVGTPPAGDSSLVAASGVAVSESSQLGIDCSSGGQSSVVLASITTGTVDSAVSAACTGGTIASAPTFFTGGAPNTVSGTTVINGAPVVQGESRGILVSELTNTGFSELVNQVGGGTQGTVFEISLPSGCDVIDDKDDNNTASSSSSTAGNLGGNDVARVTITSTAGVSASQAAGGAGNAALTNANVLQPASGSTPAKVLFRLATAPGTGTDASTKDVVLVRLDAQDLLCPTSVTGTLTATVKGINQVTAPTVTASLGKATLGTAVEAFKFAFADDVITSTKGEISTNTKIGSTPRLVGGSTTTSHPFSITENNERSIPIGGRVAARNLDPENSLLSTVLSKGQLWLIPASGSAFATAPTSMDVSFSDDSLIIDGSPTIVTGASIDPNAPIGTLLIGIKRNAATGASDPMTKKTTIIVRNLKLASATSSTTDLVSSVEFFSSDAGVIVNSPGSASANNAANPTVFTPYVQASTKALTQLEAAGVQLGTGSLANQLLTSRLTTQGTPQLNPFAKVVTSAMAADATKITVASSKATTPDGTTDNVVTVTGAAGAVDGGAEVTVTTGGTTSFDSVKVVASDDGSFIAKTRGDCAAGITSITVNATAAISGTSSTSITKTALCSGQTAQSADDVFNAIVGSDGKATISEVLTYVSAQGGLAAIVSAGGAQLQGVIKAAKSALGLS